MSTDGFNQGFSRSVEAILSTVQVGAQLGEVYLYQHEVRENLRIAGMRLDRKLESPDFPDPYALPADYEPDFGEPIEADDDHEEEV